MSKINPKVHRTDESNLISNLRGEVGEIVTSWILYGDLIRQLRGFRPASVSRLIHKPETNRLEILAEKLLDEIVARLSELAQEDIGTLTFHFAAKKLKSLQSETDFFRSFVKKHEFIKKRNYDISHKRLPEQWSDHEHIHIQPRVILKAIAIALRLMKKIDAIHLGPSSVFLWQEGRKKRYDPMTPPAAGYLILPYLRLPDKVRISLAFQEAELGLSSWDDMPTQINGKEAILKANKKWGIILLGRKIMVTPEYPLNEIVSISNS